MRMDHKLSVYGRTPPQRFWQRLKYPDDLISVPEQQCELCKRTEIEVTRHHLIPRSRHRKRQTKSAFEKSELTGRLALLCRACHKFVHRTLSEQQLAANFNTIDQLLAHPEIAKFVNWVRSKPPGLRVHSRRKP